MEENSYPTVLWWRFSNASGDNANWVNWKVEVRTLRCNYGTAASILLKGSDLISCFVNTSLTLNTFTPTGSRRRLAVLLGPSAPDRWSWHLPGQCAFPFMHLPPNIWLLSGWDQLNVISFPLTPRTSSFRFHFGFPTKPHMLPTLLNEVAALTQPGSSSESNSWTWERRITALAGWTNVFGFGQNPRLHW